jgi:hypothetical protein
MVRNPRTLMMCSLLALATGLALGSQIAPTAVALTPATRPLPALAQRLQAWGRPDTPMVAPRALPPLVATDDLDPTLDGERQPRMPRMSRDALARSPR